MSLLNNIWNSIQSNEDFANEKRITAKSILTGEVLTHGFMRRQYKLLLLLALLFFIYINNGYHCQRQQYRIMTLQDELSEAKVKALTISAQYTQMCRETNIMQMLRQHDIDLKVSTEPAIRIPASGQ